MLYNLNSGTGYWKDIFVCEHTCYGKPQHLYRVQVGMGYICWALIRGFAADMNASSLNCVLEVSQQVKHCTDAQNVGVHVVGVHYRHRIASRMVVSEVVCVIRSIEYFVCHDWHASVVQGRGVSCSAIVSHQSCVNGRQVTVCELFHEIHTILGV